MEQQQQQANAVSPSASHQPDAATRFEIVTGKEHDDYIRRHLGDRLPALQEVCDSMSTNGRLIPKECRVLVLETGCLQGRGVAMSPAAAAAWAMENPMLLRPGAAGKTARQWEDVFHRVMTSGELRDRGVFHIKGFQQYAALLPRETMQVTPAEAPDAGATSSQAAGGSAGQPSRQRPKRSAAAADDEGPHGDTPARKLTRRSNGRGTKTPVPAASVSGGDAAPKDATPAPSGQTAGAGAAAPAGVPTRAAAAPPGPPPAPAPAAPLQPPPGWRPQDLLRFSDFMRSLAFGVPSEEHPASPPPPPRT
ncbi:hypothetical protein HYH03_005707 [Edaphochlamys debaryana]|uniref:Uncharacterized protein n=1 Tax=Edaphochlamys debaryana TaxID=47281 RepID=A0A836C218_9CHLO|nr:hypothetical protein HYH03_005707 [Edaphochlamys debaryana]|eukprot:KAG2496104.1 hypothetical protein HYH03_005707 [Edaphochlamys debaryana]